MPSRVGRRHHQDRDDPASTRRLPRQGLQSRLILQVHDEPRSRIALTPRSRPSALSSSRSRKAPPACAFAWPWTSARVKTGSARNSGPNRRRLVARRSFASLPKKSCGRRSTGGACRPPSRRSPRASPPPRIRSAPAAAATPVLRPRRPSPPEPRVSRRVPGRAAGPGSGHAPGRPARHPHRGAPDGESLRHRRRSAGDAAPKPVAADAVIGASPSR
jgi:hypothetical protein